MKVGKTGIVKARKKKALTAVLLLIGLNLFSQSWVRTGNNISTKNKQDTVTIGIIQQGESFPTFPQVNGLLRVGGPVVIIDSAQNDQLLMGDVIPYTSQPNGWFKKAGTIAFMSLLDSTSPAQGVVAGIRWYQEDRLAMENKNGIVGRLVFCTQNRQIPSINQFPIIYSGAHLMLGNNNTATGAMTLSTVAVRGTAINIDDPFEVTDVGRNNYYQKIFKGGRTVFGSNIDNGIGKVQVNGKLTISTLDNGLPTDSILVTHNGEVKKAAHNCSTLITELIREIGDLKLQVKELNNASSLTAKID